MPRAEVDHPSPGRLLAFLRGHVDAAEAAAIEAHLSACPACEVAGAADRGEDALIDLLRSSFGADAGGDLAPPPAPCTGYEVLAEIGRGGMGVVYRARQRALGRVVALKRIRNGLGDDPRELTRFQNEALAAARLSHPGVVQVHDVGWHDGAPYLAMELVEGGSLDGRLRRGPLGPREAAALVSRAARAVAHAHAAGVVHRDLKPGNILLAADGTPKVGDFGLAKRLDAAAGPTLSGSPLGTPSYMAPEQAAGESAGPAADVYALGAVLYACLTGRPPFQAATPLETLRQVRDCEPVPPGRLQPGLPRDLQTACLKALEKDPSRRYESADALADDLERYLNGRPITARPVGPAVRAAKWARRRPSQAALSALAVIAAAGAAGGLLAHQARLRVEVNRANAAAASAERQRGLALANYREARDAIRAILERARDRRFAGSPRLSELTAAQAEDALRFYDRVLGASESPDPLIRLDAAIAAREAANLQIGLNRVEQAEANLGRSIKTLDALAARSPGDLRLLRERLISRVKLGVMLQSTDLARAEGVLSRAVELGEAQAAADGGSAQSRSDLAWCEHNLGSCLLLAGRPAEAEPHLERSAELRRRQVGEGQASPGVDAMLASSLVNLGLIRGAKRPDLAEAHYGEASRLLEAALEGESGTERDETALNLAELLNNWGSLAGTLGRTEDALARLARGLALVEPIRALEPGLEYPRRVAFQLHGTRANLLGTLGRHADAAEDWAHVVALNDRPAQSTTYEMLRLLALARAGDHRRASAGADPLGELVTRGPGPDGADLYNLACLHALIASAISGDPALADSDRARLAADEVRVAIDWLRRCVARGYLEDPANREQARHDPDLDSVRSHPDFIALIPPTPPKAR